MDATRVVLRTGIPLSRILEAVELDEAVLGLMEEARDPAGFLSAMVAGGHFMDAIRLLAHALPRREAVWWGWLCARDAAGATPDPEVEASLAATHAWIAEPTELHRVAALERGEAAGLDTPWGLANLAVFLSGPTIAPLNLPPVPPGEFDGAAAVLGAVALAAVAQHPDDPDTGFRDALEKGTAVADRTGLWSPAPGSAA